MIKEFNKKIEADPGFILPEGYKKVIDKNMTLAAKLGESVTKHLSSSYLDVIEVFDEIVS